MMASKRILIVDDEQPTRKLLETTLQTYGDETECARDGFEALAKVKLDIDLVLVDLQMPGMDGFEVARRIRKDPEVCDIPICMITGRASSEDRLRAVEAGVNDFIGKPFDRTELRIRHDSLLKQKEAQDARKRYEEELERIIERKTATLRKTLENMAEANRKAHQAHLDTIHRLVIAAEYKDRDTGRHIQRVGLISELLAEKLNRPSGEVETIRLASAMHDVGKIGVPEHILLKPGKLDSHEFEIVHQHTTIGANILSGSTSDVIKAGELIALTHHEKWDGSGYPQGLAGETIPLWGRICAVADVFDALICKRPYKQPYAIEKVIRIINEERGKHFDPKITDLFMDNLDAVIEIKEKYAA